MIEYPRMKKLAAAFLILYLSAGMLPAMDTAPREKAPGGGTDIIETSAGRTFTVKLKANPTTGYSWQIEKPVNRNFLRLMSSTYQREEKNLTGSGGTELWKFKAVSKGRTKISMIYVRPWEKGVPPARRYSAEILIK